MPPWHAVILGIVQGATEFLPISSTAHLIVVQRLLGRSDQQVKDDPFTVAIQLGTLVAVFIYFRADIARMVQAVWQDVKSFRLIGSESPDGRLAKLILVGTVPAGISGLLFKKILEAKFYNPTSIALVAIVFALLMYASEWWAKRKLKRGIMPRGDASIGLFDALFIGVFQAFALMPGGSRSGTTITAGLFAGLDRAAAARFSFLLSLPVILAAGLKDVIDKWHELTDPAMMQSLLIGLAVSAVVGYASIAWLLHFLKSYSTAWFVAYRIVFGILLLIAVSLGWFA